MEHFANRITLRGSLKTLPEFSHENHGKRFYRFVLDVPRLSGAVDTLPVVVQDTLLEQMDLSGGEMIRVEGQIRSHNIQNGDKRKLLIFVFAAGITCDDGEAVNDVYVEGVLCRHPTYRRTPLGREICDIMLAVKRSCHRSDYLPCILWGRTAQEISRLEVGDGVCIQGRLQSREYTKVTPEGQECRTTYEISALCAQTLEEAI